MRPQDGERTPVRHKTARVQVCLHASGLVADGRAFAVLGAHGAGKSTLAAAFAARGLAVLSDDVIPLSEVNGGFQAGSGYPRVRLWPASVAALTAIDESAPALPSDWGDRRYHLDIAQQGYRFQSTPVTLEAIYALAGRSDSSGAPHVIPLSGEEAMMALVA